MHLSSTLHPVAPQGSGLRRDQRKTEGCEQKVTESAAPLGGGGGGEKPAGPDAKAPRSTPLQNDMEVLVLGMPHSQLSPCDFGWPGWSRGQFLSWGK